MAKMTEDRLRAITDAEMQNAVGYWEGTLAQQRQKAMQYYLGEAVGDLAPPEVEGRSSVVSPDVRNTVESMLPQLMMKFAGTDQPVEFEATKPGDEEKAEQASDYCAYIYGVKNSGERITYTWMKDALLSKNGIIKVWWDTRGDEKREEYIGLSDVELAQLMDDEEVEVIEQKSYPDEEDAEQRQEAIQKLTEQAQPALQAAQTGNQQAAQALQQIQAQIAQIQATPQAMLYDVTCKRVLDKGRVCVENVPPEEFLIARNAKTIADATFVGHRVRRTRSELKTQGYKNVDGLTSDDSIAMNSEAMERYQWDDEYAGVNSDGASLDESQQVIWVTECYVRVDWDGDGISELRKVVRAGNEILENEIVDCAPFVSITPVPMPHKFFGMSIADLAMTTQLTNTGLLRGVLDNQSLEINGRYYAVENQVNLDDLLSSRPGGIVRIKAQGAVGRLDQGMGNSQQGLAMLEYMKGFNEDSTGLNRVNVGGDPAQLSHPISATQATIVDSRGDLRLDLIARNFAEGFRELWRMMLKLSAQYQQKEVIAKLRGKWVPVNPREWRNGFEATINVGLGTGNKDQLVAHLMALLQQLQLGMQIGTARPENIYAAQMELAKAMGFRSGAKFFTDPSQNPPPPAPPNPDQIKAQTAVQLKQMELQADQQKFQAQTQLEQQKAQLDHQANMAAKQAELEVQAQNDARDSQREQERAYLDQQAKSMQLDFDRWKTQLEAETRIMVAQIAAQSVATKQQDDAADNAVADEATE